MVFIEYSDKTDNYGQICPQIPLTEVIDTSFLKRNKEYYYKEKEGCWVDESKEELLKLLAVLTFILHEISYIINYFRLHW